MQHSIAHPPTLPLVERTYTESPRSARVILGCCLAFATGGFSLAETTRLSVDSAGNQGDAFSFFTAVSGDARFVAFHSAATNLVPGDTNGTADIFVRDRVAGTTERVSIGAGGVEGNGHSVEAKISFDGRYVTLRCFTTNLVPGHERLDRRVLARPRDGHDRAGERLVLGRGGQRRNLRQRHLR
jgi:hypothetical protein